MRIDLTGKVAAFLGGSPSLNDRLAGCLVASGAQVTQVIEGQVDVVVISPGRLTEKPFMDTDLDDWDSALSSNVEQSVYAMQTAARHIIGQRRSGRIIILSSVAALKPLANMSVVGTSLATLQVIAQMAAVDLGPYGITVNIIAMGVTDEGWIPRSLNVGSLTEVQRYIPLTRVGTLDDIGDVCCFLASDQAQYITGAIFPVDGGYTLTKAGAGTPPKRE